MLLACGICNSMLAGTPVTSDFSTALPVDSLTLTFRLHGQTRRYAVRLSLEADTLQLRWGIERNTQWQSGSYILTPEARRHATRLSFSQPVHGQHLLLTDATFVLLSADALEALRTTGSCTFNHTVYKVEEKETPQSAGATESPASPRVIRATDIHEGAHIVVLDDAALPLILRMTGNPVEIDWEMKW